MTSPILVSGATGATGRATIDELLKKGLPVRALVHKDDDRARQLEAKGAEVVVGDLLDLRSVRVAFKGVKRAYFVYPVAPGLIDATAYFAQAAKEAGAEYILNMSQVVARPDPPSNAALNHWVSERVFDAFGTPVTHLQPTAFHSWIGFSRKTIAQDGVFALPFGTTGKVATVGAEDLGVLIAEMLANPSDHKGKTYPVYGPTELTTPEIADIFTKTLGRPITYKTVTAGELIKSFGREMPYLEQHFNAAGEMFNNGLLAGTNDLFEKALGRRAESTEEYIVRSRDLWEAK